MKKGSQGVIYTALLAWLVSTSCWGSFGGDVYANEDDLNLQGTYDHSCPFGHPVETAPGYYGPDDVSEDLSVPPQTQPETTQHEHHFTKKRPPSLSIPSHNPGVPPIARVIKNLRKNSDESD